MSSSDYVAVAVAQASTPLMASQAGASPAKPPTKPERRTCCGMFLTWLLTFLVGCTPLCTSFFVVPPNEEVLVLFWGRLNAVYREAGLYWYNAIGRSLVRVSTRTQAFEVPKTVVVDLNGNPITVSAVVTYRIVDAVRAGLDVGDVPSYLSSQALATLKRICSQYPYESRDGHSLQHEPEHVMRQMVIALQVKADLCGVAVLSFELSDLQYDASVAAGSECGVVAPAARPLLHSRAAAAPPARPPVLVRQQAQALLDARRVIVDGGVEITMSAMARLGERGVALDARDRVRLASNLLCIITGESKVQQHAPGTGPL